MRRAILLIAFMGLGLMLVAGVALAASLTGTNKGDVLTGHADADKIAGGGGKDKITGNQNDDDLFGDHGDDLLSGNSGADFVNAADDVAGNDDVDAGEGGTDSDTCVIDLNDKVDGTAQTKTGNFSFGSCEDLWVIP